MIKKIYIIIGIMFFIFLVNGLLYPLANKTVPCYGVCVPERPPVYPFLHKLSIFITLALVIPTFPILLPILFLLNMKSLSGMEIITIYIAAFMIWLVYILIFSRLHLYIRKKTRIYDRLKKTTFVKSIKRNNKKIYAIILFALTLSISFLWYIEYRRYNPILPSCKESIAKWPEREGYTKTDYENIMCGKEDLGYAKILEENGYKRKLVYQNDGEKIKGIYFANLRNAMEWLKTQKYNTVVIAWPDYGYMIEGMTGNDVLLRSLDYYGKEEFLIANGKIWYEKPDENKFGKLIDISRILVTNDEKEAIELLKKYNATIIIVTSLEVSKSGVIFSWALGNYTQYPYEEEARRLMNRPEWKINQTYRDMIFNLSTTVNPNALFMRLLNKEEINGFKLMYNETDNMFQDDIVIYELIVKD